MGAIHAFQIAFPISMKHSQPDIILILKSSNYYHRLKDWVRIRDMVSSDPRIIMIDGYMEEQGLIYLKSGVDCYISLHRSKGWGMNILEAIIAGKPVITTAYSGSEEFMKPLYENILPELRIYAKEVPIGISGRNNIGKANYKRDMYKNYIMLML